MHKSEQLDPQSLEGEVPETVALGALADSAPVVQVHPSHNVESMFGPPSAAFSHPVHTAAVNPVRMQTDVSGSSGFADGTYRDCRVQ